MTGDAVWAAKEFSDSLPLDVQPAAAAMTTHTATVPDRKLCALAIVGRSDTVAWLLLEENRDSTNLDSGVAIATTYETCSPRHHARDNTRRPSLLAREIGTDALGRVLGNVRRRC